VDGADDVTQSDSAQDRRAFLKRMAAFAFAAPVISSFVLDSDAFADGHGQHGNNPPNQYGQNMTGQKPPPNQYGQNMTGQKPPPNQYGQNMTGQPPDHGKPPPNQYGQNMTGQPPDHGKPPPDNQKPGPPPNEYGQNQPKWDRSQRRW